MNLRWLGPYGCESIDTPNLDRLAVESIVFDSHYAHSIDAEATRAEILTGSPTSTSTRPDLRQLQEFRSAGVRTILIKEGGADLEADEIDLWGVIAEVEPDDDSGDMDELAEASVALLEDLAGADNWLMWIETDRLLPPWSVARETFDSIDLGPLLEEAVPLAEGENPDRMPPGADLERPDLEPLEDPPSTMPPNDEEYRQRLNSTYAAMICDFDAMVGYLLDQLRGKLPDRSASFTLISTSGLSLGEHGLIGPEHASLHEERVHLGWITRLPGYRLAGQRYETMTQPADVLPVLRRAHRKAASRDLVGENRPYIVSHAATEAGTTVSLRLPEWYAILPPDRKGAEVYRKPDDRWEINDIHQPHSDWVDGLYDFVRAWRAGEVLPEVRGPGE